MTIGIDFDGTLVSWNYPLVGNDIGSVDVWQGLDKKRCQNNIVYNARQGCIGGRCKLVQR